MPTESAARPLSKTEFVIETVAGWVDAQRYAPGDLLPNEAELCRELSVSRSILREGLRTLANRGLLAIQQGHGTRVCRPSATISQQSLATFIHAHQIPYEKLMEVRRPMEREIARLAAMHRRDEHLAAMADAVDRLCIHADALAACVQADMEFHQTLVDATDNPIFVIVSRSIFQMLQRGKTLTFPHAGAANVAREHRAILDAVRDRDADRAVRCIETHLASAWNDWTQVQKHHETALQEKMQ